MRQLGILASLGIAWLALTPGVMAQSRPTTIALSPYLGVLWSFEAELGGKQRTFLFDTGGGITVLTPDSAASIGCAPWGQLSGFRMRGDRIDMMRCENVAMHSSGVALTTPTVGVFDFAKLLPKDAPPLGGSVALNSFAGKIVTIDLARRQIVLETPESLKPRIAGAKEVELHLAGEISGHAVTPFVAIRSPKGKLRLELDTGSDSTIILNSHYAELFGMNGDAKGPQKFSGELVGEVALTAKDAEAMPLIIDGNIGAGILKRWVVTIDIAHERGWISRSEVH